MLLLKVVSYFKEPLVLEMQKTAEKCPSTCGQCDGHRQHQPAGFCADKCIANFAHISADRLQFCFNSFHARFKFADFAFHAGHAVSPTHNDDDAVAAIAALAARHTAATTAATRAGTAMATITASAGVV